jgi:hypothetical protein
MGCFQSMNSLGINLGDRYSAPSGLSFRSFQGLYAGPRSSLFPVIIFGNPPITIHDTAVLPARESMGSISRIYPVETIKCILQVHMNNFTYYLPLPPRSSFQSLAIQHS